MVRRRCSRVLLDYVSLDLPRCCQSVMVSNDARLSFDCTVTRLRLRLLRWTQWFAAAGTRVLLDYLSLDLPRCCQSVTVSDDVRLSFDLPVTRLRPRPLRWTQWFAAAARGFCLTLTFVFA